MNEARQPIKSPHQTLNTSSDPERKLWLEYLAKLNDRELQKARASGATTWVLFAVLAATLYQFFQLLPQLLTANISFASIGTIVVLEINLIFYLGVVVLYLVQHCKGPEERRILTDLKSRALGLLTIIFYIVAAALLFLQLVILRINTLPTFVLWVLRFLTAWWIVNLALGLRDQIKRLRQKFRIPRTAVDISMEYPGIFASLLTPVFLLAGTGLFVYVRNLAILSPDTWILGLNAGTQIVAVTFLMLFILYRILESQSRHIYLKLERDILIENTPSGEIRHQFILQVLGPRISEWLTSITEYVEKNQEEFEVLLTSGEAECIEIENIPEEYILEREGRKKQLEDKLKEGLKNFGLNVIKTISQQQQALKTYRANKHEMQIMKDQLGRLSKGDELHQKFTILMDRIARLGGD